MQTNNLIVLKNSTQRKELPGRQARGNSPVHVLLFQLNLSPIQCNLVEPAVTGKAFPRCSSMQRLPGAPHDGPVQGAERVNFTGIVGSLRGRTGHYAWTVGANSVRVS